jgi:hypothetical protein
VIASTIGMWAALWFALEGRSTRLRDLLLGGVLAGLLLVVGSGPSSAPDAETNLDAVRSIWEP